MKAVYVLLGVLLVGITAFSQKPDSIKARALDSVTITSYLREPNISRLSDIRGTYIFSGKKSEIINLDASDADITNKNARQTFAKVPGIFVYDMDGSGNQLNIAARGLDPHRGWDFNIRKDGIITNSDMYGYPASHYSMPLESISRIEIVRGTGALQYGAQFGGMLNYVTKRGDSSKRIAFESFNTVGSYNLISTYNAIGGTIGRLNYYAYYHKKKKDGYRDNEHTNSEAQSVTLEYQATPTLTLRAEWARSKYQYRIPGPLTDMMFKSNPRQATRARNYFSPDIHVPSFTAQWQVTPATKIQFVSSAVLGLRNSVLFDKPATIPDTIVLSTGEYNNRQVDIDRFRSFTNELRMLTRYTAGSFSGTVTAGIQVMNNDLHRRQLGKGTTGDDYDLTRVDPQWGRDMHFRTDNVAAYAETKLDLTSDFSITGGFRIESGKTDLDGQIIYYPENEIPVTIKHKFPLFGAGFSYKPFPGFEFYGGWSQAYHPMLFKDLIPSSLFEKVDPNIKDAKGFNIESGIRSQNGWLKWDISTFIIRYNNRFGTLSQTDDNGDFYTYRTNIGNSVSIGAELFLQGDWLIGNNMAFTAFTSTAFMDARYKNAVVKSGNDNIDIDGNKVESAPGIIARSGLTLKVRRNSFSVLYSYTGETFADALNTVDPPATGAVGLVPDYGLLDVNATMRIFHFLGLRFSLNNALDKKYFTKRPAFYPGPGVWPSEGRNVNVSFIVKI